MPTHREHKILPYTPQQMYDLVLDIESYPEFLPWCAGARIWERKKDYMMADVLVGYKMLREKFTSKVYFKPPAFAGAGSSEIQVEYLNGPLRHLHNGWIFLPEKPGQCLVDFTIDFEFHNKFLQGVIEGFFDKALKKMIDAFEARAHQLYGK